MEENEDILDMLFKEREENDLFNITTSEANKLDQNISRANEKLMEFIKKRVHPKSRNQLENLIEKYLLAIDKYSQIEKKECYKSGFADGVKIMLIALCTK